VRKKPIQKTLDETTESVKKTREEVAESIRIIDELFPEDEESRKPQTKQAPPGIAQMFAMHERQQIQQQQEERDGAAQEGRS
jgi:hypothetical protein